MEKFKVLKDSELSKERSREVSFHSDLDIVDFMKNLFFTMKMENGIGLAAPQVGKMVRAIAIDTTPVGGKTMLMAINPKIISSGGSTETSEGCLSFPGKHVTTNRSSVITVEFQDFLGNTKTRSFDGLDAVCIAHEIDHLDGITMFEREKK